MSTTSIYRISRVLFAIVLAIALLIVVTSLAQQSLPATEPGGEDPQALESKPPTFDSGDPSFQAAGILPPDENRPTAIDAPSAVFSYYQVTGATLRGRSSTAGYVYDGVGCSHVTSGTGTGRILNTEMPLPDGSIIKYLRVYYYDTNPDNGVEGYITRYQPGVATLDLIHTGSSDAFVGGYGFVVSEEITETVNNTPYAYTLIGWPDALSTANRICGLRVAYYAPAASVVFIPQVRR